MGMFIVGIISGVIFTVGGIALLCFLDEMGSRKKGTKGFYKRDNTERSKER